MGRAIYDHTSKTGYRMDVQELEERAFVVFATDPRGVAVGVVLPEDEAEKMAVAILRNIVGKKERE